MAHQGCRGVKVLKRQVRRMKTMVKMKRSLSETRKSGQK
jgi:hypothetical protein